MKVFVPAAPNAVESRPLRRSLDTVAGKVIGIIDNTKPNFNYMADDLDELLVGKYGAARVIKHRKATMGVPASDAHMKDLLKQCDAVITGMGD